MPDPIEFATARLRLRQWRADDRAPFAALNADPRVMELPPLPPILVVPKAMSTIPSAAPPSPFAPTPEPPYYAAIFSSRRTPGDNGYGQMAERMLELAAGQAGFLGVESARGADGFGITVSYWESEEAIAAWKRHAEHVVAQELGRSRWYESYELRIARVERTRSMGRPGG